MRVTVGMRKINEEVQVHMRKRSGENIQETKSKALNFENEGAGTSEEKE